VVGETLTRSRVHAVGVLLATVATAILGAFVLPQTEWQLLPHSALIIAPAAATPLAAGPRQAEPAYT
jgi:hypothetical protein